MMRRGFFPDAVIEAEAPTSRLPQCGSCGLYAECRSPKMPVAGRGKLGIMVIGEAPGEVEDDEGRPFVGPAGRKLQQVLDKVGVSLFNDCWVTNALICRPKNNKITNAKWVSYCRPNVLRAITEYKPRVVVLLGATAVKSVIGHLWREEGGGKAVGVGRWVGWQIPAHPWDAWVCPTYHPSYLLRSDGDRDRPEAPVIEADFTRHLTTAFGMVGRPFGGPAPDYRGMVTVVHDPTEAAVRLRRYTGGTVAFDYETTTLKPDGSAADIVCCSVCWEGQETIAFPWHGDAVDAMVELLDNQDVGKIASNLKFEHRWTKRQLGVAVRGWWWDTMLAAHALNPRGGITGIKFQAFVRLGMPDYDSAVGPYLKAKGGGGNDKNRVREADPNRLMVYCALDSLLEYKVAELQMREMGI